MSGNNESHLRIGLVKHYGLIQRWYIKKSANVAEVTHLEKDKATHSSANNNDSLALVDSIGIVVVNSHSGETVMGWLM